MSLLLRAPVALLLAGTIAAVAAPAAVADVTFTRSDLPDAGTIGTLELGDLDGRDGPDIVSAGAGNAVEVRLNRGDGSFGPPRSFATDGCFVFQLLLGDVADNGPGLFADGRLDAAVACGNGLLGRLPGDGTGAFGAFVSAGGEIGTAGAPGPGEDRIALARWRRPGEPPVVVYPESGYDFSSFSNYQLLCFSYDWAHHDCSQLGRPANDPANIAPGPLTAGEADGGDVDEVFAVGRTGTLNGYGIDAGPLTNRIQPFGTIDGQPRDIVIGDLQPDGRPDVLTASSSPTAASVNVIRGEAGMLGYTAVPVAAQPDLRRIALLDADGDGRPDVIEALGDGSVAVQRGDGAGGLYGPQLVAGTGFAGAGSAAVSLATGDVDRNGTTDVVIAHPLGGTIEVLRNTSAAPVPPGPGPGPGGGGTPTPPGVPGAPIPPRPLVPLRPGRAAARVALRLSGLRVVRRVALVSTSGATTVTFTVARCRAERSGRRRRTVCTTVARVSGTVRRAARVRAPLPARVSGGSYRVTASAAGARSLTRNATVAALRRPVARRPSARRRP